MAQVGYMPRRDRGARITYKTGWGWILKTKRLMALGVILVIFLQNGTASASHFFRYQPRDIKSEGPLIEITITGEHLLCDVIHRDDRWSSALNICGTWLSIDGAVYGYPGIPSWPSADPIAWTTLNQSPVLGTGTALDPLRVETTVSAGSTGIQLRQVDSYVVGEQRWRTDVEVDNTSSTTRNIVVYRAGDCTVGGSDAGFATVDTATNSIACQTAGPTTRSLRWTPITPGSTYFEGYYEDVWLNLATGMPFNNSCRCTEYIDNGAGLSWQKTLPGNSSLQESHYTTLTGKTLSEDPSPVLWPAPVYAALGDSYSSGQGLLPYFSDSVVGEGGCHRSWRAYPLQVGDPNTGIPLWMRPDARFDFIACASARTSNVKRGGDPLSGEPSQLDQAVVDAETDLVTLTLGGNDAGFSNVLAMCFWNACTSPTYTVDGVPFTDWLPAEIDDVYVPLSNVHQEIREAAPNALIMTLGYPFLFPDTDAEQNCLKLNPWDGEQDFLNSMGLRLNNVIANSAVASGHRYLDLVATFHNHEVCGAEGEWINGPTLEPFSLPPVDDTTFHPNEFGHSAMAARINTYNPDAAAQPLTTLSSRERRGIAKPDMHLRLASNDGPNPGSIGTLSTRISSGRGTCGTFNVAAPGSQVMIRTQGFTEGVVGVARLLDSRGATLRTVRGRSDVSGALRLALVIPQQLGRGSYGIEVRGRGRDGGERVAIGGIVVSRNPSLHAPC